MRRRLTLKFISLAAALIIAASSLFSCVKTEKIKDGEATDAAAGAFAASPIKDFGDISFEPVDVLSCFERTEGCDCAIASEHFRVGHDVFETLFNLILYYQKNPGDGMFDELDGYFEDGTLDPNGPVKSQVIPDGGLYWYAEVRSKTIVVCCDVLSGLELARERDAYPLSRPNLAQIEKISSAAKDGEFGGSVSEAFGERADGVTVCAAAAIIALYFNPSELYALEGYDTYDYTGFDYDEKLLPELAPLHK